ncbi:MAG: TraR/DksA C4-type zinc finger protein [Nanoarchaeota archaeon]
MKYFKDFFLKTLQEIKEENKKAFERVQLLEKEKGGDEVDLTTNERERSFILRLNGRKSFYQKKIEDALESIKDGTFGICHDCANKIEIIRLKARPTATLCLNCKEEEEREENKILYTKRSKSLGKTIKDNKNSVGLDAEISGRRKFSHEILKETVELT